VGLCSDFQCRGGFHGDGILFSQYCQHRFGIPLPISHNEVFECNLALVPRRMFQILFDGMQGWEPIQRYYAWIPALPDEAGWREWAKLLAWMPVLLVPSVSCLRAEIKRDGP
jgi:hypothetical protein